MTTSSDRAKGSARRYRQRMRAKGLRQVNMWVPDTRSESFAAACRRQSILAAGTDQDEGILEELDVLVDEIEGWDV